MEPENQPTAPATHSDAPQPVAPLVEGTSPEAALAAFPALAQAAAPPVPAGPPEPGSLLWFFLGPHGLRAGWSIAILIPTMLFISGIAGAILLFTHLIGKQPVHGSPSTAFFNELIMLAGLAGAAAIVALIEQRKRNLLEYNLLGLNRVRNFVVGTVVGFAALSLLVGLLKLGGWITIAPSGLDPRSLLGYGFLWAATFLLVGFYEEGTFRCYLQATWTRGINLWWALGIQIVTCTLLLWFGKGNGVRSVVAFAALGLLPCVWLALRKADSARFWIAAWVASTLFAVLHVGNNGENWVGIFSVAAIGFVFAVSVKLTGSAWWAIGFHAAWDWAETYFYGTADSGMQAQGSYLLSNPKGDAFWSGGSVGPEGSILVLAVIVITLVSLILFYGCKAPASPEA